MRRLAAPLAALLLSGGVARVASAQARPDTIRAALRYARADVDFLTGMIFHHAQAIAMARWAPSHGASPTVQTLCARIINAQGDEITLMQNWLGDHHESVPQPDPRGMPMAGMSEPMLMPGMLTPLQMAQLDSARGQRFDELFLRFMIQHHHGAIEMVNHLFDAGAGEEETVNKLALGVFADQTTEITRMQGMLATLVYSH